MRRRTLVALAAATAVGTDLIAWLSMLALGPGMDGFVRNEGETWNTLVHGNNITMAE